MTIEEYQRLTGEKPPEPPERTCEVCGGSTWIEEHTAPTFERVVRCVGCLSKHHNQPYEKPQDKV